MKQLLEKFTEEVESEIIHFEMAIECFEQGCAEWNFCAGKLEVLRQILQKISVIAKGK